MEGSHRLNSVLLNATVPNPSSYLATSKIVDAAQYQKLLISVAYLDITTLIIRYFHDREGTQPFFSTVEILNSPPGTYITREAIKGQYVQVELFYPTVVPTGPLSYYVELIR